MNIKNKLVGLLLCICMVIMLTPYASAAVDDEFTDTGSGLKFTVLTENVPASTGTVLVVYNGYGGTSCNIPGTVSYNGFTYTVTSIGVSAFSGCSSLTSISISDSVTDIGISAFSGTGITSVTIPASVENVWDYAFDKCPDLTSVTFMGLTPPDIGGYAFGYPNSNESDDTSVETVTIPAGTQVDYGNELSGKLPTGAAIESAAAVITKVTITPSSVDVIKGGTQTFTAAVEGTGSFSPAVTWSVAGSSSGSSIGQADGVLTVANNENAATLTVKATSLANQNVVSEATVTVKSAGPAEQFSLPAGSTCYFDLSGITVSAGIVNMALPDTSLKWVPYTYVGTLNAYSLDTSSSGVTGASVTAATNASNRSLFVADHNVYLNISWNALRHTSLPDNDLIYGKSFTANSVSYLLRSLSAGSGYGSPSSNEWDQILVKGNYIHNYSDFYSWGQDTSSSSDTRRVLRGDGTFGIAFFTLAANSQHSSGMYQYNFRPALEILNAGSLSSDALKTVTYTMGTNGTLGSGSLKSAAVVYTGELTLPEIADTNGFTYTGASQSGMLLGWLYGTTFYPSGTKLSSLPSGAVLTAGYGVPNNLPKRKTETLPGVSASIQVNAAYTLDLSTIFEDSDNDILTYIVSVNGSAPIFAAEAYTFTPIAAGNITLEFKVSDGKGLSSDSYTVTINAYNSGGGGGGGSGSPSYTAKVSGDGLTETTLPITVERATGSAAVDIGAQHGSLVTDGKALEITFPSISGVTAYSVGIPTAYLSSTDGKGELRVSTDTGTLTIPSNMLTGIKLPDGSSGISGCKAEISVGQGVKTGLPDEVKAAIGNKPLISLSLSIDGKQTNWNNPDAPVTVSIPYIPTAAELRNPESVVIWYIDGSGNAVSVPNGHYDPATGTVTFTTTHFSNYAVVYNKVNFTDVSDTAWYSNAVGFISARGIATGTGNGCYSPDAKLTRGEFMVMMMRAYSIAPDESPKDNFSDAGSTYYTGYLAAAKRLGISAGVGNNLFAADKEITRQEMFTLLYNALKFIGQLPQGTKLPDGSSGKPLSDFADAGQIDSWAKDAMTLLVETGTVGGNAGKLSPTGTTTRAELAQVLYNLAIR